MIRVKLDAMDTTYPDVESFLEEYVTDDDVEEFINECYEPVKLPFGDLVDAGRAIRAIYDYRSFKGIKDDYIMNEVEYIEDELSVNGRMDYRGWEIIDTDFEEKS